MMKALSIGLGFAALLLALPASGRALETAPQEKSDALQRSQQILAEEQRQHTVGQKLRGAFQHFEELVEDLQSNGMITESKAADLTPAIKVLKKVADKHVEAAREHLQKARRGPDSLDHLKAADREIDEALALLNELLKLAGTLEKKENVTKEIEQIIKDHEKLNADTKEVG